MVNRSQNSESSGSDHLKLNTPVKAYSREAVNRRTYTGCQVQPNLSQNNSLNSRRSRESVKRSRSNSESLQHKSVKRIDSSPECSGSGNSELNIPSHCCRERIEFKF